MFANIDLYATKGIEYILALSFLASLVVFWIFFNSKAFAPARARVVQRVGSMVDWFRIPEGILFHQGHSWLQTERGPEGSVTIGMDDFAQRMMGKVDAVELAGVGMTVRQGEPGWALKVGKKTVNMLSPVTGRILSVNKETLSTPSLINKDPYGKGWLLRVKPEQIERESKNLLSGGLVRRWMEDVTEKLRLRMGQEPGLVYQDGGLPVEGMAKHIDAQNWDVMMAEFFLTNKS